jgi:hypothetical protein
VESQVWDEAREEWRGVDGVSMCCGYNNPISPFENMYVIQMMREAILEAEAIDWEMDNQGENADEGVSVKVER